MREFDFLIVTESLQTIIHIEAKRSKTVLNKDKAAEQLQKGLHFAKENLPFPENERWKYTRVLYFGSGKEGKNTTDDPFTCCPDCKPFVIDSQTNIPEWCSHMSSGISASIPTIQSASTYILMCKFLLHQMFQQGQCVTQNDIIKYTEETSDAIFTPQNIIFWSNEQFKLLNDSQLTRICFISPFGTGKTTLIKAKARELIEDGQNVTFVFFEEADSPKETLLQKTYLMEFPKASFVTLKGID